MSEAASTLKIDELTVARGGKRCCTGSRSRFPRAR